MKLWVRSCHGFVNISTQSLWHLPHMCSSACMAGMLFQIRLCAGARKMIRYPRGSSRRAEFSGERRTCCVSNLFIILSSLALLQLRSTLCSHHWVNAYYNKLCVKLLNSVLGGQGIIHFATNWRDPTSWGADMAASAALLWKATYCLNIAYYRTLLNQIFTDPTLLLQFQQYRNL